MFAKQYDGIARQRGRYRKAGLGVEVGAGQGRSQAKSKGWQEIMGRLRMCGEKIPSRRWVALRRW